MNEAVWKIVETTTFLVTCGNIDHLLPPQVHHHRCYRERRRSRGWEPARIWNHCWRNLSGLRGDHYNQHGENPHVRVGWMWDFQQQWGDAPSAFQVTCRAIGIGAYLVRLGQRVIQVENSHIILTGASALNKVCIFPVFQFFVIAKYEWTSINLVQCGKFWSNCWMHWGWRGEKCSEAILGSDVNIQFISLFMNSLFAFLCRF